MNKEFLFNPVLVKKIRAATLAHLVYHKERKAKRVSQMCILFYSNLSDIKKI